MKQSNDSMTCPVCHEGNLQVFIEIEDLPVHCNLLWASQQEAISAPRGDIRLGYCHVCGMIYNLSFDSTKMEYTQDYETSLHFSGHFREYAQETVGRLVDRYQLYGKNIIEIGCGKGEFLSLLCEGGRNQGVGFDKSYDGRSDKNGKAQHLTFIADFYSQEYKDYPVDLICCRHVLEHIHSPREFLTEVRLAIGDRKNTSVFFEVPNALYTLRDLGIWDVIYEHCSYFSAGSLRRIFSETGFEVREIYETYGGQFLCIEATAANLNTFSTMDRSEDLKEISHLVSVFAEFYRDKVERWKTNLRELVQKNGRAVVWGAGSKGVTFLNTLKVNDQIEYVIDVNPHKQGKYVPGASQAVVHPSLLSEYRPDIIYLMNPNYCDEVRQMIKNMDVTAEVVAV